MENLAEIPNSDSEHRSRSRSSRRPSGQRGEKNSQGSSKGKRAGNSAPRPLGSLTFVIPRRAPFRLLIGIAIMAHHQRRPFRLFFEDEAREKGLQSGSNTIFTFNRNDELDDFLAVVKQPFFSHQHKRYDEFFRLADELLLGTAEGLVVSLVNVYGARLNRPMDDQEQYRVIALTIEDIQLLLANRDAYLLARETKYPTIRGTVVLGDCCRFRYRIVTADQPRKVIMTKQDELLVIYHPDHGRFGYCTVVSNREDIPLRNVLRAVQLKEYQLRHGELPPKDDKDPFKDLPWTWEDNTHFMCGNHHRRASSAPLVTAEVLDALLKFLHDQSRKRAQKST